MPSNLGSGAEGLWIGVWGTFMLAFHCLGLGVSSSGSKPQPKNLSIALV